MNAMAQMGRWMWLAALPVAVALTAARAEPPTDTTRVPELVRQLDAPRRAERQAAEAALIELGPTILDLLPEAGDVPSAEARLRLQRVRRRLERAATEAALRLPEVSLGKVTLRRSPEPSGAGTIRIELHATWPRSVRVITLRQPMSEVRALDEHGRPVAVGDPRAVREVILDEPKQEATLPITLDLPAGEDSTPDAATIAKLTGRMTATLLGPVRALRFPNPASARNAQQSVGEAAVTLERFTRHGELWEGRLRVAFDRPGRSLESYRGWVFQNRAMLELPDGKRLEPVGSETFLQTPESVGVAYRFDVGRLPEGAVLVYHTPTAIVNRDVPYELDLAEALQGRTDKAAPAFTDEQ